MEKSESAPSSLPGLWELHYPVALRADDLAKTYIDASANTYLLPEIEHDFEASRQLGEAGLSSGTVIEVEGMEMVSYGPDTNLLPLTALLNASEHDAVNQGDLVGVLGKITRQLEAMGQTCHFLPRRLTSEMVAIDRACDRIELLPPFSTAGTGGGATSPLELMRGLRDDLLEKSVSKRQRDMILDVFSRSTGEA